MKQRISGPRLGRLLDGWGARVGPLHDQLADALQQVLASGAVERGTALPSERALSATLAVSRTTVATAYDRLRADGWLDSRHGSSTWVRRGSDLTHRTGDRLNSYVSSAADVIDLSSSALAGLPMVAEATRGEWLSELPELLAGSGFQPYGLDLLRDRVAHYYDALGLATREEHVLVTNGCQHALQLLAEAMLEPGDTVVVEDTTYRGALETFRLRGARPLPVPTDAEGMDLDQLERAARSERPRLVYLLPTAHNPTGRSWSRARREGLARIAARHDLTVVDDGSTMDLRFADAAPRPLALDLPSDAVITLGSMTKLFWGGLRVGWVRGTEDVLAPLAQLRCAFDLGGSLVAQLLAAELLPRAAEARALRRGQLRSAYEHVTDKLAELLPDWTWHEPDGGAALWVRTVEDAVALSERLHRHGLRLNPGAVYSPGDGFREFLRLPLSAEPTVIEAGLHRIAGARDGRRRAS